MLSFSKTYWSVSITKRQSIVEMKSLGKVIKDNIGLVDSQVYFPTKFYSTSRGDVLTLKFKC